jgi:hypothetical protein
MCPNTFAKKISIISHTNFFIIMIENNLGEINQNMAKL